MTQTTGLARILEKLAHTMEEYRESHIHSTALSRLSPALIQYFDAVHHLQNPTVSEVADYMKVSRPSCSLALDKLEEKGLVGRTQSDNDRRSTRLFLTKAGLKMASLHDMAYITFTRHLTEELTADEAATLQKILTKALTGIHNGLLEEGGEG